jgi:putative hydrolase of the HAD superfamily
MNLQKLLPTDLANIRVVLFDVYGTLMKQIPNPAMQEGFARWWKKHFIGSAPGMENFEAKLAERIEQSHVQSRAAGVDFPEVQWEQIVHATIADFGQSVEEPDALRNISTELAEVKSSPVLMPGAAELIQDLRARDLPLGIVSNAQPYTAVHLDRCLRGAGINPWPFHDEWTFWSWRHGFSKPSPHVFQVLSARAEALGWQREQILYFGDQMEKDIIPAKKAGWRTVLVPMTQVCNF